jgi:DNA-binding IclR family transcriptional regulator
MIELTDDEKKVVEAMKVLKAVAENQIKDLDQIAKAAMMPKGKVGNIVIGLVNKKVVKRIAREKAAGYFVIESMLQ